MTPNHIVYLELPTSDVNACKQFYGSVFGWSFQDYGPEYAAFTQSGLDGGLNGDASQKTRSPLAVIATNDIIGMEKKVASLGGKITVATFAFPGGRRFHFVDPAGNELAVMQPDGSLEARES